jgi:hypothetical protein
VAERVVTRVNRAVQIKDVKDRIAVELLLEDDVVKIRKLSQGRDGVKLPDLEEAVKFLKGGS